MTRGLHAVGFVSAIAGLAGCGASGVVTGTSGASGAGPGSGTGAASGTGTGGTTGGKGTSTAGGSTGSKGTTGGSTGAKGTSGSGSGSGSSAGTTTGGSAGVTFTVDLGKGPARQFNPPSAPAPVSPYIYGVNDFAAWNQTTKWGLLRWGGDGFTDWNWTNNWSNAGSDWCFSQINQAGAGQPAVVAGAIGGSAYPSVPTAQALGEASLITVPILGWVASQAVTNNLWSGSTPPCPGTPSCSGGGGVPTAVNAANLPFVSTDASSKAFVANNAVKGSAFCTGGSASCAIDQAGPVFQDEFVSYVKATWGSGGAPIFFMLDNEPNYWPGTHPELWPGYTGSPGCGTDGIVTYADIENDDITFATAIKNVWPEAKVYGPVVAGDGWIYARNYPQGGTPLFADDYLKALATASDSYGKPLLDVFDIHYYTSGGSPAQCLQVSRMFWDPSFTEWSPSETDQMDYGYSNNLFDTTLYPRQLVPRLLGLIATDYGGHTQPAPGLSFSEYNAGCERQIEGGVAEADMLGVFGREGVTAATAWPLKTITNGNALANYLVAAYDLYRNYDGSGSTVGDLAVYAHTSDVQDTSVYAFAHSDGSVGAELVALNKEGSPLAISVTLSNAQAYTTATAYQLVDAGGGAPRVAAVSSNPTLSCSGGSCTVTATLAATSATTIVLR